MHATIFHLHSNYANQEVMWFGGDSQQKYQTNLKEHRHELEKYNWIDHPITYKFNSHGFRSNEFNDRPSIMFLGCSHTLGVGLPVEMTWTHLVSQQLNLESCNLGLASGSCDSAFRIANHYIPKLKPQIVFLLAPDQARLEILGTDSIEALTAMDSTGLAKENFYRKWLSVEENQRMNQEKNILAIKHLCQVNNIKFANLYSWHTVNYGNDTADKARDLQHWGQLRNQDIANHALETIHQI